MFELSNLQPAGKKRKRVGRGGCHGGTSGKGHKGQNARSGGGTRLGFEGGQMPLHRRLPKRGFTNARFSKDISIVNIGQLDSRFNDGDTISLDSLVGSGLVKPKKSESRLVKNRTMIKILGNGELSKKLIVKAHLFSKSARDAIEKAGGQIEVLQVEVQKER